MRVPISEEEAEYLKIVCRDAIINILPEILENGQERRRKQAKDQSMRAEANAKLMKIAKWSSRDKTVLWYF